VFLEKETQMQQTTNRTILGTYSDFKLVKTRSVVQMIIEIPIEQSNQVTEMFGMPTPSEEKWVAVALIDTQHINRNEDATRAIQSAGMICKNEAFGEWLKTERGMVDLDPTDPDAIADALRALLGIRSRTDFHRDSEAITAFHRLKGEFDSYQMEN
jgi:hypothetical protein